MLKAGRLQYWFNPGITARNGRCIAGNAGHVFRRLVSRYWGAIIAISFCLALFTGIGQPPTLSFWSIAFVVTLAAFLYTCRRFYVGVKINAHLLLARLGLQPKTASRHYVRALFDGYAERFDHHLMVELSYQAPNLIVGMLGDRLRRGRETVADLGCGTGICGPLLRRHSDCLIGVDLSPKMLELAKRKNCYDKLVRSNIVEFLDQQRDVLDLCVAADVLVYIGNLDEVFAAAFKALREDGLFAFTVEAVNGEGWTLQSTGRYVHSEAYVGALAKRHGFEVLGKKRAALRTQSDEPVAGFVWMLGKPHKEAPV